MSREKPVDWLDKVNLGGLMHRKFRDDDSARKQGIGNRHIVGIVKIEQPNYGDMRFIIWSALPLFELLDIDVSVIEQILVHKNHKMVEHLDKQDAKRRSYFRALQKQIKVIKTVLKNLGVL